MLTGTRLWANWRSVEIGENPQPAGPTPLIGESSKGIWYPIPFRIALPAGIPRRKVRVRCSS